MKYAVLTFSILQVALSLGQETGSFSLNIDFDEPDYNMSNELAFYVPTGYDEMTAYPLIVGFRGGPHSGPGHLRDQLQPLSDSLGAIIMCPESVGLWQGGQEELVKPLFQYAVDTTAAIYNIDMTMIYVTGLSFGGRHTVITSMDTDSGPIYPGLRGIIPFAAGTNSENVADYGLDTSAPICTCIGSDDASFYNVSYILHQSATASGHTTLFNEIPDVGHTMAFPTFIEEMMECFDFIEAQYLTNLQEFDDFEFELYPNPSADFITVRAPVAAGTRISIFDVSGREVARGGVQPSFASGSVDISNLPAGRYLVSVAIDNFPSSSSGSSGTPRRSSKWFVKE